MNFPQHDYPGQVILGLSSYVKLAILDFPYPIPIAIPRKTLPPINVYFSGATAQMSAPTVKMALAVMIIFLRPNRSLDGPLISEPTNAIPKSEEHMIISLPDELWENMGYFEHLSCVDRVGRLSIRDGGRSINWRKTFLGGAATRQAIFSR